MSARGWRTWVATSLCLGFAAGVGTGGCQDAATCASICALPGAPDGCENDCEDVQGSCEQAGASADFQEYLTCVENTGSFPAMSDGVCTAEATAVTNECPTSSQSSPGGTSVDAGGGSADASGHEAQVATGPCALGGACTMPGAVCTLAGQGPCDSDERLACDATSHTFVADGFPCTSPSNVACGFGSVGSGGAPGCSETCSCSNGLMICTGNCPDGGPASP